MERCDFSSVMTIVRRFISDEYNTNQTELLEDVFSSFFDQPDDSVAFDMALICRWFTGQAKISSKISQFYSKVGNREKLAEDLEDGVLPLMYDSSMATQELYRLREVSDVVVVCVYSGTACYCFLVTILACLLYTSDAADESLPV